MSDSEAPLLCPVCLVSMGVQLSKECAELGQRRRDIFLARNRAPTPICINKGREYHWVVLIAGV